MKFPELEKWFSRYGIGDVEWDDQEDAYVIEDYDSEGFDKNILDSCFDEEDGPWERSEKNDTVKYEHEEYDATAEIGDDDFALYIPPIASKARHNELKVRLAGGPAVATMEELVEWQCDPPEDAKHTLYN